MRAVMALKSSPAGAFAWAVWHSHADANGGAECGRARVQFRYLQARMEASPDETYALWTTKSVDSIGPGGTKLDPSVVCQARPRVPPP